ncbi:MAG: DUF2172 domain-containing protein [Vicinamibacterales bacterium]
MRFEATPLGGLVRIDVEPFVDSRGLFARTWCDREAAAAGLRTPMVQQSIGVNSKAGTLRGLHYQSPLPQVKVMRCLQGSAFFAAVDIRRSSPTFLHTFDLILDSRTHTAVYVPPGIAVEVPDARRRHGDRLHDGGALRSAVRARRTLERSGVRASMARRRSYHQRSRRDLSGLQSGCGRCAVTRTQDVPASAAAASVGVEMHALVRRLFPICRSLTGNGVRDTLRMLAEYAPLEQHEVPSGTAIFDWVVPREWNLRDAYIADPSGHRIVDFKANSLHLVGYSVPVRQTMTLSELQPHLHSLPSQPALIPYRTLVLPRALGFLPVTRAAALARRRSVRRGGRQPIGRRSSHVW